MESSDGKSETKAVHHAHSRRVGGVGTQSQRTQPQQVGGDWNADFGQGSQYVQTRETKVGKILRGLISTTREQIKLLENQVELWETELEDLERMDEE